MQGTGRGSDKAVARPVVERLSRPTLPVPRSNGIPGPIPAQGDFLDPRWRPINPGAVSETISFQKPGWVSPRDWDAFRKAVARGSCYTVVHRVTGTYQSLRRYLHHLQAQRSERREMEWWQVELEEIDILESRLREIRVRLEAARHPDEPTTSLQWVEVDEVLIAADQVSAQTKALVQGGKLPGLRWDPDRGVVKATSVRRLVESEA